MTRSKIIDQRIVGRRESVKGGAMQRPGSPVGRTAAGNESPYDRIKQAIMEGTFEPGQALTEAALSEWCGVSRTPVREALGRLEQDGLVTRNGRAVLVTERTPEEILGIYETRIALETAAARMAAVHYGVLDRVRL